MAIIPGKWQVFTLDSGPVVVRSTDGDTEYMVARCYGDGNGDQISTATLIAAAPDLLAGLKKTVSLLSYAAQGGGIYGCNADEWFQMEESARAAIAKAEGRE